MKITRRQLRRIIREEVKSTKKYNDDSALKGKQSKLPDALQKGIIDKTVEDREEDEEEEAIEESITRISKRQLKRIIREALLLEFKIPYDIGKFADDLQDIARAAGRDDVDRTIEAFNSGYIGIAFEIDGEEWYIFDQPGKVGLEDQQMANITMQKGADRKMGVRDRDIAWKGLYFSPRSARGFGNVDFTPAEKQEAYDAIADEFGNLIGV